MIAFLLSDYNIVFAGSLSIFLAITLLEFFLLFLGMSLMVDSDSDVDADVDAEAKVGYDGDATFDFIKWTGFGKIPLTAFIAVFTAIFGMVGYTINFIAMELTGSLLGAAITVPLALLATFPIVSSIAGTIAKIIPKFESNTIRVEDLVGHEAEIYIGTATHQRSTSATVRDKHGVQHTVMVRSSVEGVNLTESMKVRLVTYQADGYFYATPI